MIVVRPLPVVCVKLAARTPLVVTSAALLIKIAPKGVPSPTRPVIVMLPPAVKVKSSVPAVVPSTMLLNKMLPVPLSVLIATSFVNVTPVRKLISVLAPVERMLPPSTFTPAPF